MTDEAPPPDPRLQDITFLSEYGYDDFRAVALTLPSFPVVVHLPGIYQAADVVKQMRKHVDSAPPITFPG
ncbi:MAG TPA: hypothetical protein VGL56_02550 [Fimbriimonadaceae bacterium]